MYIGLRTSDTLHKKSCRIGPGLCGTSENTYSPTLGEYYEGGRLRALITVERCLEALGLSFMTTEFDHPTSPVMAALTFSLFSTQPARTLLRRHHRLKGCHLAQRRSDLCRGVRIIDPIVLELLPSLAPVILALLAPG